MKSILVSFIREILFVFRLWKPSVPVELSQQISAFISVNKGKWKTINEADTKILVEGHLSEYGPNYLVRTAVAAKALQDKIGGSIEIVANGYSYQWMTARKVYKSFGIKRWILLGRHFLLLNPFIFVIGWGLAFWQFLRLKTPEDIIKIHFGILKTGDLVYDEVLRSEKVFTIERVNFSVLKTLARSWYYYLQYQVLFRKKPYKYYISTHTAYPEYGLLCRVALLHKIVVVETSDIQMSTYKSIGDGELPTYHDGINRAIRKDLLNGSVSVELREQRAKLLLEKRLDSELNQLDAKKAYSGRVYQPSELKNELGLPEESKIGFVVAHIFADSPHLSSSMLHADYYKWLEETLICCSKSGNINWVVKPHPSCALYGEEDKVNQLVHDLAANNVFMCPSDLNTSSLTNCADFILTVHGTAGLEYSCLGIPTILAGKPFYSGFGFTYEPENKKEYEKCIRDAIDIPRLSVQQISKALQVFEVWDRQFDWHNPIITSEVQANVWGSGVSRDVAKAYQIITNNLQHNDLKKLKLWDFVQSVVD